MKIKKVLILSVMGFILWAAWGSKVNAEEDINYAHLQEEPIRIAVEDWSTLEELQHRLTAVPKDSIFIHVKSEGLNMRETAQRVKLCWNVNHSRNHYSVSISDAVEQAQDSDVLRPFLGLFGEEAEAIMKQAAEEEDSYISFIRLERVDELEICTFEVRADREKQYHLLITGEREDTKVEFQHLVIPATWYTSYGYWTWFGRYVISQVDLNFDGEKDLLIHEGSSWGSGGAWNNYRAVVWDKTVEEFVWYSSFPEQISHLDFENKRVVDRYQSGVGYEVVCEYGVVDGEYAKTRELIWEYHGETGTCTLSYCEMGILVKEYDATNMDLDEIATLYPDLDYWWRG
ncbi:MAG: hypothetical protein J1F42_10275 [Lachnospiraceae bacterium]|nr:hypothetical protein [Lachnospiraceae bacterium]